MDFHVKWSYNLWIILSWKGIASSTHSSVLSNQLSTFSWWWTHRYWRWVQERNACPRIRYGSSYWTLELDSYARNLFFHWSWRFLMWYPSSDRCNRLPFWSHRQCSGSFLLVLQHSALPKSWSIPAFTWTPPKDKKPSLFLICCFSYLHSL